MLNSDQLFEQAKAQLVKYWGFADFRPGQDKVVKSVLQKKDTLVLFPTGGGKSLCYQVPALVFPGLSLIISPLVALMQDQVESLKKKGISATFINSTLHPGEIDQRLINARNGLYKMLYLAPERLGSKVFQGELLNLPLDMVAIDEAHCISEWGHRFRPSYRKIRENLRAVEDKVAWIALTATATPNVKEDIEASLEFKNPTIIAKGYVRDNLGYRVEENENKTLRLKELLHRAKGKGGGLIYGTTRKSCEDLAALIRSMEIKSEPYHAGLESKERNRIQEGWISGKIPWVAATNAFGMGIDKPDCRFVFHESPPASLEAYYQEAGRAGRDGGLSHPILLYTKTDFIRLKDNLTTAYPDFTILHAVYSAIADIGTVALGEFRETSILADVDQVKKRAKVESAYIKNAIELLEQFEVWTTNELQDKNIQVQFVWSLDMLDTYIQQLKNAEKATFIDTLIRSCSPQAFFQMETIEVSYLSKRLKMTPQIIKKGLTILKQEGMIDFRFLDKHYSINFLDARTNQVPINKKVYERYRDVQFEKLAKVELYTRSKDCRNAFFSAYFGDVLKKYSCGVCDNCLNKKKKY
ncbi:MAG: RecQ family ATP-dependent DNA helicase [Bacteroidetes bacterium]|nr:RecQ family ATP-dependent DNA helicase [Bacteroidota bacterium]